MKRLGYDEPAIHHTISGACPLFHAVHSAIKRAALPSTARSAAM